MKKLTSVFLLLLLALYPLYFGAGGYRTLEQDKYPIFLLLCGGMTLLAVGYTASKHRSRKQRPAVFVWFAAALLLALIVSAVFSPYPARVWLGGQRKDGVLTWALYLGVFLAVASWGRLTAIHDAALSVCLAVTAVLAFSQRLGANPLGLYPPEYSWHSGGKGFLATVGNVDFLSAFAVLGTALLLGRYMTAKSKLRWIPLVGAVFGVLALYLAGADAAKLGLYAALGCGLLLCVRKRVWTQRFAFGCAALAFALAMLGGLQGWRTPNGQTVRFALTETALRRLLIALVCGAAGVGIGKIRLPKLLRRYRYMLVLGVEICAVVLVVLGTKGRTNSIASQLLQVLQGTATKQTGSGRYEIWQQTLSLIRERVLLGGGPDTMGLRNLASSADNAHSVFLNLWVNGGLFSMLSYALVLGAVVLPSLRKKKSQTAALLPAVVAYAVQASVTVDEFLVAPLFWAVLGLLAGQNGTAFNLLKTKK